MGKIRHTALEKIRAQYKSTMMPKPMSKQVWKLNYIRTRVPKLASPGPATKIPWQNEATFDFLAQNNACYGSPNAVP